MPGGMVLNLINIIFPFIFMILFGVQMYSVIGWIVTVITDRHNIDKRKKYATMCLTVMVIFAVILVSIYLFLIKEQVINGGLSSSS